MTMDIKKDPAGSMTSIAMEEYELLGDSKYRNYVTAMDKTLRNFEYSSGWPDMISAVGKLKKLIMGNMKYPIIPRRIVISKRLAQCMHPALPSGLHLQALDTYDIIFKCMGTSRLSQELFIYSAGLFPLLGHAAMNVRPSLLTIYETHFVPLGERLRPALSGFLSGVLPGLEEASDHFERTNTLLEQVCEGVESSYFYGCLWECILSNSGVRLPALNYCLAHFNKKLSMEDQIYIMGTEVDILVNGLCAALQDNSALVQRSALDFLLMGFPVHNVQLVREDMIKLMTAAVTTLLRRDMSLDRRLFIWLMGSEVNVSLLNSDHPLVKRTENQLGSCSDDGSDEEINPYFDLYSRALLIQSLRRIFSWIQPQDVPDVRPYRLLISFFEKPEIGPFIVDDILIEVFRSLYQICKVSKVPEKSPEVGKKPPMQKGYRPVADTIRIANVMFATLEPSFIWEYVLQMYEKALKLEKSAPEAKVPDDSSVVQSVCGHPPRIIEMCALIDFLLDIVSIDTYLATPTLHLPQLFQKMMCAMTVHCHELTAEEVTCSLRTCRKILSKVQPTFPQEKRKTVVVSTHDVVGGTPEDTNNNLCRVTSMTATSKHTSGDKLQQDNLTQLTWECTIQHERFFVQFVTSKIFASSVNYCKVFRRIQKEASKDRNTWLENLLKGRSEDTEVTMKLPGTDQPHVPVRDGVNDYCAAMQHSCDLLLELSSFPSSEISHEHCPAGSGCNKLPSWLQVLLISGCYMSPKNCDLQFTAISTFLDLMSLTENANKASKVALHKTFSQEHIPGDEGVTTVLFSSLLKPVHVEYILNNTHIIERLASSLWLLLGTVPPGSHFKCVELLNTLLNAVPEPTEVEHVICRSLSEEREAGQIENFQRFSILWHLSRELAKSSGRTFEKLLLKMLDNLVHPTGPLKSLSQNWMLHALLRGDVARIVEPLLHMLLDPATARVSVLHVRIQPSETPRKIVDNDEPAKIYAISSVDGNVIYHVSNDAGKKKPINDPKRIFALTTLSSNSSYVTASSGRADESVQNTPMSMFVNPLTKFPEEELASPEQKSEDGDGGGKALGSSSESVSCGVCSLNSWGSRSSGLEIVESLLKEVIDSVVDGRHDATKTPASHNVNSLHSHILLYCQVYDSKRTLYALQTLRNILNTNSRVTICALSTTSVVSTDTHKGREIQTLLASHHKSVFGKGFHGEAQEGVGNYRSSMYIEVWITVTLYFARSFYPNLGQMRLTEEELRGNCEVQLLSVEVLSLLISELIPIVRESGKGFSSYIGDLLVTCKLQKVVLQCLVSSVYDMKKGNAEVGGTFTDDILLFNKGLDPAGKTCNYSESMQIQLLRLLLALIMLEEKTHKGEEGGKVEHHPVNLHPKTLRYIPGLPLPQQPMFLTAILVTLKQDHLRHLHQHWTNFVTSALPYMGKSLTHVIVNVISQLCTNLERLANYYHRKSTDAITLPSDYIVTQLDALTMLTHYCLLDTALQVTYAFPQPPVTTTMGVSGANPGQILNNLISVFMPSPSLQSPGQRESTPPLDPHLVARRNVLCKLPRIVESAAVLWQAVTTTKDQTAWVVGSPQVIQHHLVEFLSPIARHHSNSFLAAIAVAWQERRAKTSTKKFLPTCTPSQLVLVDLVSTIKVMPIDTLVQTVHQVVKQPPLIEGPQKVPLEVSLLHFFYAYLKTVTTPQLIECWDSLLSLLKEGLTLSPPAQFLILAIVNEFVQRMPPFTERKEQRDVQEICGKLIEACSNIAGSCLTQTTWFKRQLAVKHALQQDAINDSFEPEETPRKSPVQSEIPIHASHSVSATSIGTQYSVQAQVVLAELLAPMLDVIYGSDEKDKVIPLLTNIMHYVTPYLREHSRLNVPSFLACSQLLASLSSYQYTQKAWKKDVCELLLNTNLFQMDSASMPYWRTIVDNLITHDKAVFLDLMRCEQRCHMLKLLAFSIFCSEKDQYRRFMPDIQERLTESLRLPQVVPSIHAHVFLCFRVLLLRMNPSHVTSLWPAIISELVQVFLQLEQELHTDTEEFSTHIRRLATLDSSWVLNSENGLNAHNNPAWLQLYLSACKLLDLALLLPANMLPQFQMYRWAFVGEAGSQNRISEEGHVRPDFIPHVTRLARLMDSKAAAQSPEVRSRSRTPLLRSATITGIMDLHPFFTSLSKYPKEEPIGTGFMDSEGCFQRVLRMAEESLQEDFLEPLIS